jgi:heat shock protein HslJ
MKLIFDAVRMSHLVGDAGTLGRIVFGILIPIISAGCASAGGKENASADAVLGKVWQWESIVTPQQAIEVANPERYVLEFMADNKASMRFDCNRGGGSYQMASGQLTFGPLVSTRMGCPPGSLGDRFGQELGRVTSFSLDHGKLYLNLPDNGGTLRFHAGDPASGAEK